MVEEKSIELFVTEEESLLLEALALAEAPHNQRAQAILAVDAGSTMEQAARVANLKVTQVRFWLGRFRNSRITVFPESLIEEIKSMLEARQKEKAAKARSKTKAKTKKKSKAKSKAKAKQSKKMKAGANKSDKQKKKKSDKKKKDSDSKSKKTKKMKDQKKKKSNPKTTKKKK